MLFNCSSYTLPFLILELGRRAIYAATFRDAYSGGTVRVYHVKKNGWKLISEEDSVDLHEKYTKK